MQGFVNAFLFPGISGQMKKSALGIGPVSYTHLIESGVAYRFTKGSWYIEPDICYALYTCLLYTSTLFHLSGNARKEKSIYEALQEIPNLKVDLSMRKIKTADEQNVCLLYTSRR